MYMRPNVNSVESSGHHLSARCSVWWQPAFGATRGSRGPSRAHRHLPLTLLLSGRRVCRTLQGTTGASLYYQRPSSGWILLHFWQSFSCHLRCSPLAVQSWSPVGRLRRLNSLQLLTQPRAHKNACGLWLTDVTSAPCQPDLGVGAESEATPNSPFTGHSVLAGRTAEYIKLCKF